MSATGAAATAALAFEGVGATAAGRPVLRNISFALGAGETLAVVGPSGAGKSTLARLAVGLIPASAGRVLIEGRDLARLDATELPRLRRAAQLVWQDPRRSLDPTQSVAAILAEGLELQARKGEVPGGYFSRRRRQWREALAREWLPRVGLEPGLAARLPGALSGGQRQRVAVARALARAPRLLVTDEPTAALDPPTGRQILELIADFQRSTGLAWLLISHQLAQAAEFAQRIAVLDQGGIVETGLARELSARPAHELTRRLLAAQPPWPPHTKPGVA